MKHALITLLAFSTLTTPVFADTKASGQDIAMLLESNGKVIVDQGEGYRPALPKMMLSAGQTIVIGKESSAIIVYNSCAVVLKETAKYSLPAIAPCDGEQAAMVVDGVVIEPVSADACEPGIACEINNSGTSQAAHGSYNNASLAGSGDVTPMVVAGGFVLGTAVAAIVGTIVDKDNPASP